MNANIGAILRDIRNIKRKTTLFPPGQDIITSAKQLKKIKSSQQININTFMDNKNQKIKNIDEKLQIHQSEIEKNNQIIKELTSQFLIIKEQFAKEREKSLMEQRKNKLLREQIQRTNKLLRVKTIKVDQLIKVKETLQKQLQSFKPLMQKNDEYVATIASLRKQIKTLQDSVQQSKQKIQDKQKQCTKIKQKSSQIDILKAKISQLLAQSTAKDSIINNYKFSIHQYSIEKDKDISQKLNLQKQIEKLNVQMQQLRKSKVSVERQYVAMEKKYNETSKKLQHLQNEKNDIQSKVKSHKSEQNRARSQLQQLKQKNEDLIAKYNQKVTECNLQSTKIQKSAQKVKDLEIKVCQYKDQKDKLAQIQTKFDQLKKKGKNLQVLYNGMLPQVQCPFGHELKETVTIIPCGHNYCLGCKKGYHKQCSQCKGKLKIEAVYRNQLMDDLINIIGSVKQVIQYVK